MIFIGFLDRALDVLGLIYLTKGVWMLARNHGFRRSFF